jgi:hypothetical protein
MTAPDRRWIEPPGVVAARWGKQRRYRTEANDPIDAQRFGTLRQMNLPI